MQNFVEREHTRHIFDWGCGASFLSFTGGAYKLYYFILGHLCTYTCIYVYLQLNALFFQVVRRDITEPGASCSATVQLMPAATRWQDLAGARRVTPVNAASKVHTAFSLHAVP